MIHRNLSEWCQYPDVPEGMTSEDETTDGGGDNDDDVGQDLVTASGGSGEHKGGHTAARLDVARAEVEVARAFVHGC